MAAGSVGSARPKIRERRPDTLLGKEWRQWCALENALRAESWPGEPLLTIGETRQELQCLPPSIDVRLLEAREGSRLSGLGRLLVPTESKVAFFTLGVRPSRRKLGIGTQLLQRAVCSAPVQVTDLETSTTDSAPDGEAFLRLKRAQPVEFSEVWEASIPDTAALPIQNHHSPPPIPGRPLTPWQTCDPWPDRLLADVLRLKQELSGDDGGSGWIWTPDRLREAEAALVAQGIEWGRVGVLDTGGNLVGYTELLLNPGRPDTALQGDTVVAPPYRRKGLARWLKAAALTTIQRIAPEVRTVRTVMGNENHAIRALNRSLGFVPIRRMTRWRIGIQDLCAAESGQDLMALEANVKSPPRAVDEG